MRLKLENNTSKQNTVIGIFKVLTGVQYAEAYT
jgi:hypothetical protein